MGIAQTPFASPLVLGGHTFNPAWEPERFPTEDGFLRLLSTAFERGIRHIDATFEAEVQVVGHLLKRRGPPPGVGVGCLQAYVITRTAEDQRAQLLRWLDVLGLPSLDYLYVFPPPDPAQVEELRRQRAEGRFRALGLWLRTPADPVADDLFDFVATVYNPARTEMASRLQELSARGLSVLTLEPLGYGSLLSNLPAADRPAAARRLLRHALTRPWRGAAAVTMRTIAEIEANAEAASAVGDDGPLPSTYDGHHLTWHGGFPVISGPWDGRFGSAPLDSL